MPKDRFERNTRLCVGYTFFTEDDAKCVKKANAFERNLKLGTLQLSGLINSSRSSGRAYIDIAATTATTHISYSSVQRSAVYSAHFNIATPQLNAYMINSEMFGLAAGFYETYLAPPEMTILIVGCESSGKTALLERFKCSNFSNSLPHRSAASKESKTSTVDNYGINEESNYSDVNDVVADPDETRKMLPLHKIRPTIGLNIGKTAACGCKCIFWDVGGQEKMRPLWERYYNDVHAVIFVVDSTKCRFMCGDRAKDEETKANMSEVQSVFESMWRNEKLSRREVPVMIFAGKRDEECEDEDELLLDPIEIEKLFCTWQEMEVPYDGSNEEKIPSKPISKRSLKLFGGSAKTGEGVHEALKWLVEDLKRRFTKSRQHSL